MIPVLMIYISMRLCSWQEYFPIMLFSTKTVNLRYLSSTFHFYRFLPYYIVTDSDLVDLVESQASYFYFTIKYKCESKGVKLSKLVNTLNNLNGWTGSLIGLRLDDWMKKCTAVCLLVTYRFRQAYNPIPHLPEISFYQWRLVVRRIFSSLNPQ